jgi:hypothetical protein
MLLTDADEKVHDGTDVTVLQAVTRLMAMKLKYLLESVLQRYRQADY